ncbi:hypothetical protein [Metabacillus halosaccharovorans]|uniref:hypothetical protein n=1 Tax=Metabacillus halosaccharovorans TaxID=930124 RepID=UPI001C1F5B3F|nr:hypothetical protein [Metabacillus halosaccharovorans]MBU7592785.1 hypothetical protein [Metabacillus halosaccharovorans]
MNLYKICFYLIIGSILVSCSNKEIASEINLEEKIKVELNNSNIYYDDVIHYEVKDNFVIAFYTVTNQLFHSVFDISTGNPVFITGGGSLGQDGGIMTSGKNEDFPYYFSYLISNNPDVKLVEVNGMAAKNIVSNNFSFWVAFNKQLITEENYTAYDNKGNEVKLIIREE